MAIIYKITNDINDKVYIGQTSQTLMDRWNGHCKGNVGKYQQLKDCKGKFSGNLHRDMMTYGVDHFSIEEIERCTQEEKNEKEKYWIKYYNSYEDGYNSTTGGGVKIIKGDLSPVLKEKNELDRMLEEYQIIKDEYEKKQKELLPYKRKIKKMELELKKYILANIDNEIDKVWREAPFNSMSRVSQYIINTNNFLTDLDKGEVYSSIKNYLKKNFGYSSTKENGKGELGEYIIEQVKFGSNSYPFIKLTYDDGNQNEWGEIKNSI